MKDKIEQTIKSTIIAYEANNHLDKLWKEPIIEIISTKNEKLKILREAVFNCILAVPFAFHNGLLCEILTFCYIQFSNFNPLIL